MTERLAEYATVHSAMARARVIVAVSELHGGMCGLLCAGGAAAIPGWVEECLGNGEPVEDALGAVRDQLRELELDSWRSLTGSGLDFYPLLPDDDTDLAERVASLALWCQGFLFGLGLAGFALEDESLGESDAAALEELVNDFSEISRAGLSAGEFDDDDEADFALTELIEYVRVGVQIVFETLEPMRVEAGAATTLH